MFGSLACPNLSLVEFWVWFVHVFDSQQHHERKVENASLTFFLESKTSYKIEKNAKNVYTHTNFDVL